MLKSMTGYGRAEQQVGDKVFLIEIRSLNGKQFEMLLKLPQLLKPYEFDIRNVISEKLVRGSIECIISLKQNGAVKPVSINMDLARSYFKPLQELSDELKLDSSQLLASILKLPEVITPSTDVFNEKEWAEFRTVLDQALEAINQHRVIEGEALEKDLSLRIQNIGIQQEEVIRQEPQRRQKIRENILKLLDEHVGAEKTDSNRLEQEMIYYIEKIDISEEQVRLKNHCDYFKTLLAENEDVKGKKLSFILQEIGREINTTGAKAYDSEIQKSVVLMKDELEKAKEQVLNVL
ncbi:YicC/YloC family endoribonuclease [Pollutibacter soli]|uniref:YicC/YloC family endoribonuclease n=1 Tax=Pollutibacter soli TaxID=3034157 RepID=UPI0030138A5A